MAAKKVTGPVKDQLHLMELKELTYLAFQTSTSHVPAQPQAQKPRRQPHADGACVGKD